MKTIVRICFFFTLSMSFAQTNLIDTSTWTVGTGSVTGFIRSGVDAENIREMGIGPQGTSVLLWKTIPEATGNVGAGGWTTDRLSIDPTKTYRFTVWLKKTNSLDGSTYFGLRAYDASDNYATNYLSGGFVGIPYFWSGDPPALDQWYLLVGYVHHDAYSVTTDIGGVYDTSGTKVEGSQDYKFQSNAIEVVQSIFLTSNTNPSDSQFYYDPTLYEINGQEPTIQELINGPDTENPTAPTLSSTTQTDSSASLTWTAATDNVAVTGYKIYKDGTLESTLGNILNYNVTGLTASTAYNFTVTTLDAAGNESVASNTLNITTNSTSGDTENPTAPTLSSTVQTDTTVDLSWSGATDNIAVTGYKIFKDGVLESTLGNVLTYQVTSLTASTSYNFTVTALDAAGNESVVSNTLAITTEAASGGGSGHWTLNTQNIYYNTGNVGIGTTTPDEKLAVNGNIHTKEVRVDLNSWPDYVFTKEYKLLSLEKVKKYIEEKGHLPNVPSAKEVEKHGVKLGMMNAKLLEKIEELTLYILEQKKEIDFQNNQNARFQKRLTRLEELINKIEK